MTSVKDIYHIDSNITLLNNVYTDNGKVKLDGLTRDPETQTNWIVFASSDSTELDKTKYPLSVIKKLFKLTTSNGSNTTPIYSEW